MYEDVNTLSRWASDIHRQLRDGGDRDQVGRRTELLLADLSTLFKFHPGAPITDLVVEDCRQQVLSSEAGDLLHRVDAPALEAIEKTWRTGTGPLSDAIENWPQLIVSAGGELGDLSHASLSAIQRRNLQAEEKRVALRVARENEMRAPAAMIASVRKSVFLLVCEGCLSPSEAEPIEDLMDVARSRLDAIFEYPERISDRHPALVLGRSLMRLLEFAGFRSRETPFTRERAACYCVALAADCGFAVSPTTLRSLPSVL